MMIICMSSESYALTYSYVVEGYETIDDVTTHFTGRAVLDVNDGVLTGNGFYDTNFDELFNSFSISVTYDDDVESFDSMWAVNQFDNGLRALDLGGDYYNNYNGAMAMNGRSGNRYNTGMESWAITAGDTVADSFDDYRYWGDCGVSSQRSQLLFTLTRDSNSADPVPEPATMFLLSLGLVGLVGFRKKI